MYSLLRTLGGRKVAWLGLAFLALGVLRFLFGNGVLS